MEKKTLCCSQHVEEMFGFTDKYLCICLIRAWFHPLFHWFPDIPKTNQKKKWKLRQTNAFALLETSETLRINEPVWKGANLFIVKPKGAPLVSRVKPLNQPAGPRGLSDLRWCWTASPSTLFPCRVISVLRPQQTVTLHLMLWKWRGGGASLRCLTEAETRVGPHRQEQGQTHTACPAAGHRETDRYTYSRLQLWAVIDMFDIQRGKKCSDLWRIKMFNSVSISIRKKY